MLTNDLKEEDNLYGINLKVDGKWYYLGDGCLSEDIPLAMVSKSEAYVWHIIEHFDLKAEGASRFVQSTLGVMDLMLRSQCESMNDPEGDYAKLFLSRTVPYRKLEMIEDYIRKFDPDGEVWSMAPMYKIVDLNRYGTVALRSEESCEARILDQAQEYGIYTP